MSKTASFFDCIALIIVLLIIPGCGAEGEISGESPNTTKVIITLGTGPTEALSTSSVGSVPTEVYYIDVEVRADDMERVTEGIYRKKTGSYACGDEITGEEAIVEVPNGGDRVFIVRAYDGSACNDSGNIIYSARSGPIDLIGEDVTLILTMQPASPPSAPTGVRCTAGNEQITIGWDTVSGATGYRIYWATESGVSKDTYNSRIENITSNTYDHTGLTNGTTYYYVVTAENDSGEGDESDEVSATPSATGTNVSPTATIASPLDGSTYTEGDTISFSGAGFDAEDGTLTGSSLLWTSNIDGEFGTGESVTRNDLLAGTHTITLTASDSKGATGTDSVSIEIEFGGPVEDPEALPLSDYSSLGENFLYVANERGGTVVQIAPDGTAGIVGTGFPGASGLAIKSGDTELYVSDDTQKVSLIQTDGTRATLLEGYFDNPNALAFDGEGRLLVGDVGDSIWRFDLSGTTPVGEKLAEGLGSQAVGEFDGDVFFTEWSGYVYRIAPSDTLPVTPSTVEQFTAVPIVEGTEGGMAISADGTSYVSDYIDGRVVQVNPDGTYEALMRFSDFKARGLVLNPEQTTLYVTGYEADRILEIDLASKTAFLFADGTTTEDLLDGPFGMVITPVAFATVTLE